MSERAFAADSEAAAVQRRIDPETDLLHDLMAGANDPRTPQSILREWWIREQREQREQRGREPSELSYDPQV